jgi:hypothetical protein
MALSYEELDLRGRHLVAHLRACARYAEKVNAPDTTSTAGGLERLAVHWNSAVTLTLAVRGAVSPPTFGDWLRRHRIPLGTARRLLGK